MPELSPYLSFDGNCAEAMRFYARTLGGELKDLLTYREILGEHAPPGSESLIMHAYLVLGPHSIMAGDPPPGMQYEAIKGVHINLTYPGPAEARRVFDALADGGRVIVPIQKTEWAEAFGMLVDRYGTPWSINGGPLMG